MYEDNPDDDWIILWKTRHVVDLLLVMFRLTETELKVQCA